MTEFLEFAQYGAHFQLFAIVLALWSIPWKGYALWIAAKNSHKWWFIVLLIVNTVAILEIIYIFAIGRPALRQTQGGQPIT